MLMGGNDMSNEFCSMHWIIQLWYVCRNCKNDFIRKNGLKIINQSVCFAMHSNIFWKHLN